MKITTAVLAGSLLLAAPAQGQERPRDESPVVVTIGEGVVRRVPDRAWVTLTAESRAKTPQEAQRTNAEVMNAVLQKLKGMGLPPDAILTSRVDLQPEYDYQNNKRTLRGYVARNAVEVRVDDLPKLGEIIDLAVTAGASLVSDVRFGLKDRAAAEREALTQAVSDARERANAAASGAGLRVERVLRIEEQRIGEIGPPRPMIAMAEQVRVESPTPVEPGELEIRARVTLTAAVR